MTIRQMTHADLPDVLKIVERTFPTEANAVHFDLLTGINDHDWASGEYIFCDQYVVVDDGVCGFGGFYQLSDTPKKSAGINWMAINPDSQGQGYGRQLLTYLENKAALMFDTVFVHADIPSVGFYKKMGYEQCTGHTQEMPETIFLSKRL